MWLLGCFAASLLAMTAMIVAAQRTGRNPGLDWASRKGFSHDRP